MDHVLIVEIISAILLLFGLLVGVCLGYAIRSWRLHVQVGGFIIALFGTVGSWVAFIVLQVVVTYMKNWRISFGNLELFSVAWALAGTLFSVFVFGHLLRAAQLVLSRSTKSATTTI